MTYLVKFISFLLYSIEVTLLLVCSYLTLVLFGLFIPVNTDYDPNNGEIEIFVISNGVHTDICLPTKSSFIDWRNYISTQPFNGISNEPEYISFGWGDKGFFLDTLEWSDLTVPTALTAAFIPSTTAMHVAYIAEKPIENRFIKRCHLTKKNHKKIIDFIQKSFLQNKNSSPILIVNSGYSDNDNFYDEAKGNYHLFQTCNTWTNNALKIAGIKTSLLAVTDQGILRHL